MQVRAWMVIRAIVFVALFPAFAGCASETGEPLARADIHAGDAPTEPLTPPWASVDDAVIRPGTLIHTEKRDCPSNFLYTREDNGAAFLGTTAYCARDMAIGSVATVGDDGTALAVLVYSSAITMAETGETDPNALEYNDLALFLLDSQAARKANPTLRGAAGPTGLAEAASQQIGARIRSFSHSQDLPDATDWREGIVSGKAGEWALLSYHVLPGAPGAMGGTAIDPEGRAVGVMVTLGVLPNPGANGVARLDTMLAYASERAKLHVVLATATDTDSP